MRADIREAFEAAIDDVAGSSFVWSDRKSQTTIRREATLLMKRVERVLENLPDQSMTVLELYEEIAGEACKG
ncbi:MAG: hypothetical protein ABTQ31_17235 [Rhizobiaceae bacterium]